MDKEQFEIKEEHLKLMKEFVVGWQDCEYGAPEIDPKRPYGNSNVEQDMVEALGLEEKSKNTWLFKLFGKEYFLTGEDKNNLSIDDHEDLIKELRKLHEEMETALQICLDTQKFEIGKFETEEYTDDWKKIENEPA